MRVSRLLTSAVISLTSVYSSSASQAGSTVITLTSQQAGVTPFIVMLNFSISNPSTLQSVQFVIKPKPGSVTRPVSAIYPVTYLEARGYFNPSVQQATVPVFGLYSNYSNSVILTWVFNDGSSQQGTIVVPASNYTDPCGFANPIVLQARTQDTSLSYDYILVKSNCSANSPTIIDTDGTIRWVGTTGVEGSNPLQDHGSYTFFDNAIYSAGSHLAVDGLVRNELDGTVSVVVADYSAFGATGFHHNIDYGKSGIILDVNTPRYVMSTNIEVDKNGQVLKTWSLGDIISAAMTSGGDDPSQFVYPSPTDWFHNNSVTYRKSDNSLIVSSRENFVICIDYDTNVIKWILGDPTKKWYQFPSLKRFALAVASGGVPPIGQHAVSITYDDNLLLFDNGAPSNFQTPKGSVRLYSSPRKYELDLQTDVATEVWNYPRNQSVDSGSCGGIYEDAPLNYLADYATRTLNGNPVAEILGLNAAGNVVFDYAYPTNYQCDTAFSTIPLHLEQVSFSSVAPTPTPTPTATPTPTPTPTATPTPVADPIFLPTPGDYYNAATYYLFIGMACSTPHSQEYFTSDGSTPAPPPTAHGTNIPQEAGYAGGFAAKNSPVGLKVIAFKPGLANSNVVSGTYTIHSTADSRTQIPDPQLGPPAGSYQLDASQTQMSFIVATAIPGAAMRYTLDGSTPNPSHGILINQNVGRIDFSLPLSQSSKTLNLQVIAYGLSKTASNVKTFTIILNR